MHNKIILVILSLSLVACTTAGRQITPLQLANNEVVTWHYICKDAYGLEVEYANMGGEYTVTIYNNELAKRVLQKIAEYEYDNGEWQWSLDQNDTFTLTQNGKIITSNCRSYSETDNSGIVLLR